VPVDIFCVGDYPAAVGEEDRIERPWRGESGEGGLDLRDGYPAIRSDRGQFLCIDVGDRPPAPGEDGLLHACPPEGVLRDDADTVLLDPDRLDLACAPDDLLGVKVAGDEVSKPAGAQGNGRQVPAVDEDRHRCLFSGIPGELPAADAGAGDLLEHIPHVVGCRHRGAPGAARS